MKNINRFFPIRFLPVLLIPFLINGCVTDSAIEDKTSEEITITYTLTKDQTHNKFSRLIEPVLKVEDGAIIEAFTEEAADEQIKPGMTREEFDSLEDYDPNLIHPLTGPVYVEGAMPGDVLQVTLHVVEIGDWG